MSLWDGVGIEVESCPVPFEDADTDADADDDDEELPKPRVLERLMRVLHPHLSRPARSASRCFSLGPTRLYPASTRFSMHKSQWCTKKLRPRETWSSRYASGREQCFSAMRRERARTEDSV